MAGKQHLGHRTYLDRRRSRKRITTMSENGVTKRVVFALVASVMLSGLTAGCRYRSAARSTACKQRGIAFSSQVDGLRRAALEKLTIGATKEDVVRFFAENKF